MGSVSQQKQDTIACVQRGVGVKTVNMLKKQAGVQIDQSRSDLLLDHVDQVLRNVQIFFAVDINARVLNPLAMIQMMFVTVLHVHSWPNHLPCFVA